MCIFSLRDSYNGKNNYEWHKFTNFFFEDELKTYILNKYSDITEEEIDDWIEKSRSGISELRISSKKGLDLLECNHSFDYTAKLLSAIERAIPMSDKTLPDIPNWVADEYGYCPIVDNVHKFLVVKLSMIILLNCIDNDVVNGKIIFPLHDQVLIGDYVHHKGNSKVITGLDANIILQDTVPSFKANFNAFNSCLKSLKEEGITGLTLTISCEAAK